MASTGTAVDSEPETGNVVTVLIHTDDNGEVTAVQPDRFEISKGNHQQVLWQVSNPGAHFNVTFDAGSPFEYTQFSDAEPYSGLVRREVLADLSNYYSYKVTVTPRNDAASTKGSKPFDPGGIVTP